MRSSARLGALAGAAQAAPYTLVQYVSSSFCESEMFVCQYVEANICSHTAAVTRGVTTDVYAKLVEKPDAAGIFELSACLDSGCACDFVQDLRIDQCDGDTAANTSRKLVEGHIDKCVSINADVGLARWHDRLHAAHSSMPSEEAVNTATSEDTDPSWADDAVGGTFLQVSRRLQGRWASQASSSFVQRRAAAAKLAAAKRTQSLVQPPIHKDGQTVVADWHMEYNASPPDQASVTTLLVLVCFVRFVAM